MVKGKIKIKRIDDAASRQVTFTKRRKGLFKKAMDLSVLCDARIGVIVISSTKRVYDFATNGSMKELFEEYNKIKEEGRVINSSSEAKLWKIEAEFLRRQLHDLGKQYRALKGEYLGDLNYQELENLDKQIQTSIMALRARKEALMYNETMDMKRKTFTMNQVDEKMQNKKDHFVLEKEPLEGRLSPSINLNVVKDPLELQLCLPQEDNEFLINYGS